MQHREYLAGFRAFEVTLRFCRRRVQGKVSYER